MCGQTTVRNDVRRNGAAKAPQTTPNPTASREWRFDGLEFAQVGCGGDIPQISGKHAGKIYEAITGRPTTSDCATFWDTRSMGSHQWSLDDGTVLDWCPIARVFTVMGSVPTAAAKRLDALEKEIGKSELEGPTPCEELAALLLLLDLLGDDELSVTTLVLA